MKGTRLTVSPEKLTELREDAAEEQAPAVTAGEDHTDPDHALTQLALKLTQEQDARSRAAGQFASTFQRYDTTIKGIGRSLTDAVISGPPAETALRVARVLLANSYLLGLDDQLDTLALLKDTAATADEVADEEEPCPCNPDGKGRHRGGPKCRHWEPK
ncbi:hypothetical protein [Streptomyces sp. CS014]|uniref:hypothetical protein n=1 Tax=Streptomyces sp. CS014 TaxID=2162707 RepID=UPI000D51E399|nr:hypothetical protein [Streptomyces sp. CS014]PVD04434.1 hypothetical protein DBP12_03145 [Streptomyces sp. CS014]